MGPGDQIMARRALYLLIVCVSWSEHTAYIPREDDVYITPLNWTPPFPMDNGISSWKILEFKPQYIERFESSSSIEPLNCLSFQGIKLDYKQLQFIDDGAFQGLSCTEILDLSHNKLDSLTNGMFSGLNLKMLDASFNAIATIDFDLFTLTNLYILDLSHNEIVYLPNIIRQMTKLRLLNLSHNKLSAVSPIWLQNLDALEELYLDHNSLTVFGMYLGGISLKKLNLAHNSLIDIKLATKLSLEVLNISDNYLTDLYINNNNFASKKLKILDMRNNQWQCDTLSIIEWKFDVADTSVRRPAGCHNGQYRSSICSEGTLLTRDPKDTEIRYLRFTASCLESRIESIDSYIIYLFCIAFTIILLDIITVIIKFRAHRRATRLIRERRGEVIDNNVV